MPPAANKSAFNTPWFNSQDRSFFNSLNKSSSPPNLILTAETPGFDPSLPPKFQSEGFRTVYIPLSTPHSTYIQRLHAAGDAFGTAEEYAIVAYGDAASVVLTAHTKPSHPKLVGIVGYYPGVIPDVTRTSFPASVHLLVHLVGSDVEVERTPEVLGLQGGKKKRLKKAIGKGVGFGGGLGRLGKGEGMLTFVYPECENGFAETDLDEYDREAEGVAFARTLGCLRRAFRKDRESYEGVERVRDSFAGLTMGGQGGNGVVKWVEEYGSVIYGPTLGGGIGQQQLKRFYDDFFTLLPKSTTVQLVSRTVGADRVVDELHVSLTHDCEVGWLLPGIPPTGKKVEIMLVSVVCVRGGKLESEHIYWDQASVLVQVGLLDPKVIPKSFRQKGVEELPVTGAEAVRAMKRGSSKHINELIPDW